ncbi:small VCP/p97-interacting protein-like [Pocillopora damicornis]|uniref:small VCP/p97-interacting protein-like n=1 Tax=Pocillopora damicornis TaxID=46731 RepID=UPI000F557EBE|nr:small VCP/p97-interacting protein-like [Pocillopora damicornis]
MGNCYDCFSSQPEVETPDPEIRRRQQEEAALKRQQQADGRGVKDPERLKRQQKRREDAEREALKHGPSDGGLKVSTFWHEQVHLLYF